MSVPTLLKKGHLQLGKDLTPSPETPINYIINWLKSRMPEFGGKDASLNNRILVVQAETASGKSTVLPVAVFRILRSENTPSGLRYKGPSVICTQPKVLTAIVLATKDIAGKAYNPDMILGQTVGFQTGPISNKPIAGLLYATAGVLAAQLRNQEDSEIMARYRFILIDEAHERAMDIDMTLMLLRNFYQRNIGNPKLPFLMLTSATFDTARYARYFNVSFDNIVRVVGRTFPIDIVWPQSGNNDYTLESVSTTMRIHNENLDDPPERSDILIFMPGDAEVKAVKEALEAAVLKMTTEKMFLVLSVDRNVVNSQAGDYPLIFADPKTLPRVKGKHPIRRVIISTSVAETGLTIDTLKYIIDCGWSRTSETYQPYKVVGLTTRPAPRSRIKQRKGRVGRLFPGTFYPLYTENVYDALEEQQAPDIITNGPSDYLLAIMNEQHKQKLRLGIRSEFRIEDMNLLDAPPPEAFMESNTNAILLGFVSPNASLPNKWPPLTSTETDEKGYGLTALGFLGAAFPKTPMECIRILFSGYVWDVAASDLITIVAAINVGNELKKFFSTDKDLQPSPNELPIESAAMKIALPQFVLTRYGAGETAGGAAVDVIPPSESEQFYFRAKLLICDDFIEIMLLFDMLIRKIDELNDLNKFIDYCVDLNINYENVFEFLRARDQVIEEMLMVGLNPYRNDEKRLSLRPPEDFINGIRSIKKCIFDGLRSRVLHWDPNNEKGPAYVTSCGIRVKAPELFTDPIANRLRVLNIIKPSPDALRPMWILTNKIELKIIKRGKPAQLLYEIKTNLVSVLDGYVDPDINYGTPRSFS